jgi:hypothetical protein
MYGSVIVKSNMPGRIDTFSVQRYECTLGYFFKDPFIDLLQEVQNKSNGNHTSFISLQLTVGKRI